MEEKEGSLEAVLANRSGQGNRARKWAYRNYCAYCPEILAVTQSSYTRTASLAVDLLLASCVVLNACRDVD
jgi:hypothetical protein